MGDQPTPEPTATRAAMTPRTSALRAYVDRRVAPVSSLATVTELVAAGAGNGIDTSRGLLFNHSLWARDRIVTALDLLPYDTRPARQTVRVLAALQGTRERRRSEEERGRIHNERRDLRRWKAPPYLKMLFGLVIAPVWGGGLGGYVSYFAADTTPLYVVLVRALAEREPEVLDEVVGDRDGGAVTVADTVDRAVTWIERHIEPDGLVVVPRRNPASLPGQTWRDGPTSNLDEHGHLLNVATPVAWLDVQALSFAALRDAAVMLRLRAAASPGAASALEARAATLDEASQRLRRVTLRRFWSDEEEGFGIAVARDGSAGGRLITARQSNGGWLLALGLFDGLSDEQRSRYVGGIVHGLFAPGMLTEAGLRGRALRDHNPRFRNYHENVWPVDTCIAARGLRRYGLDKLAEQLEARLLNTANMLAGHDEFVVVDDRGRVVDPLLTAASGRALFGSVHAVPVEMRPEHELAWSATALLALKRARAQRARARFSAPHATSAPRPRWVDGLTREVLAAIPDRGPLATRAQLRECFVALSPSYLDHSTGLRRSITMVAGEGVRLAARAAFARLSRVGAERSQRAALKRPADVGDGRRRQKWERNGSGAAAPARAGLGGGSFSPSSRP